MCERTYVVSQRIIKNAFKLINVHPQMERKRTSRTEGSARPTTNDQRQMKAFVFLYSFFLKKRIKVSFLLNLFFKKIKETQNDIEKEKRIKLDDQGI